MVGGLLEGANRQINVPKHTLFRNHIRILETKTIEKDIWKDRGEVKERLIDNIWNMRKYNEQSNGHFFYNLFKENFNKDYSEITDYSNIEMEYSFPYWFTGAINEEEFIGRVEGYNNLKDFSKSYVDRDIIFRYGLNKISFDTEKIDKSINFNTNILGVIEVKDCEIAIIDIEHESRPLFILTDDSELNIEMQLISKIISTLHDGKTYYSQINQIYENQILEICCNRTAEIEHKMKILQSEHGFEVDELNVDIEQLENLNELQKDQHASLIAQNDFLRQQIISLNDEIENMQPPYYSTGGSADVYRGPRL